MRLRVPGPDRHVRCLIMKVGRNDPFPCGSGKKYKKCCLAKDEVTARTQVIAAVPPPEAAPQADQLGWQTQQEPAAREWQERAQSEPPLDDEVATESEDSREPDWPPLPAEDQQLVDAWWKEVWPVYAGKGGKENGGWLLERTLEFLDQQPRLFRYLYLYEEFLFEMGGALARAGRMEDHLALLRRLRREQPETYFQCFGYYDHDLIAEAIRTGRREEIPTCLDLFRQHPVKHIDQLSDVVDLLAWRGCEMELRELLEPTAQTAAGSPDVLGGDFGLLWLTELTMFPFLETGDDSPEVVNQMCQAVFAVGYLDESNQGNHEALRRQLRLASRPPTEAGLDVKQRGDEWWFHDIGWSFTGWAHRTKALPWTSARFLADALLDYWRWKDEEQKRASDPFGLSETRLDHYLARRCRDLHWPKGVRALSTLQAFHYFTEYLVAHGHLSAADAGGLQSATARSYETIRGAVDACDPAYRICPTYDALIAGPADRSV